MEQKVVVKAIKSCIDQLYNKDKYLFDCRACERCLMFRLAHYLQIKFFNYFADCEFNKMGFNKYKARDKVEPTNRDSRLKKMYVDIIIHKRNSNVQDNFICLEIKRTKRGMDDDLERLKNMTCENGFRYENTNYVYAYDFGFLIYLSKNKAKSEIKIFKNGEEL